MIPAIVRSVEVDGEVIDYHWEYGRVTVTWENVLPGWQMATGLVRIHDDAKNVPGSWHSSVVVIVKNGTFRLDMYHGEKPYAPTGHEFKAFYAYLASLGLQRKYHIRATTGKKPRVVKKSQLDKSLLTIIKPSHTNGNYSQK